jgi:hypothetical protein
MEDLLSELGARVESPTWEPLRRQLLEICRLFLNVSADAKSEIVSYYVKFTVGTAPTSSTYAAIWLKNTKRLIVGLALPEGYEAEGLGPALPGTAYKGLTKYFTIEPGGEVPKRLGEWVGLAYQNVLSADGKSHRSITSWTP